MPSVITVDDELQLPPGTEILRVARDNMRFQWRAIVEYPFDWCVNRVSGMRGDLVGADYDYDYNEEA